MDEIRIAPPKTKMVSGGMKIATWRTASYANDQPPAKRCSRGLRRGHERPSIEALTLNKLPRILLRNMLIKVLYFLGLHFICNENLCRFGLLWRYCTCSCKGDDLEWLAPTLAGFEIDWKILRFSCIHIIKMNPLQRLSLYQRFCRLLQLSNNIYIKNIWLSRKHVFENYQLRL